MRRTIIALALAAIPAAAFAQSTEWQIFQDPAGDKLVQAFVVAADNTQLIFKCDKKGKGVYAIVLTKETLAPPFNQDLVNKVTLRFDDGGPKEDRWRYRETSARAVDAPGERSLTRLLEQLADAKKLEIQLYPNDPRAKPIAIDFDVHDARPAIGQVYTSCGGKNPIG